MNEQSPSSEQSRWDTRYAQASGNDLLGNVNPLLEEAVRILDLPTLPGRALDIAGGSGADALFLASQGLDATLVDLSPKGLELARHESVKRSLALRTAVIDTEVDPLPEGPWDLIHIAHYLHRPTIGAAIGGLGPGGLLVIAIATAKNLQRHQRPPERFLLRPGELLELVDNHESEGLEAGGLEVIRFDENWRPNGVHEAWLIASR